MMLDEINTLKLNSGNDINIDNDQKEKKKENKTALIGFLREIKEGYNKNEMTLIIRKKLAELTNIEERNYEFAIDVFLEKFKNMFSSLGKNERFGVVFPILLL